MQDVPNPSPEHSATTQGASASEELASSDAGCAEPQPCSKAHTCRGPNLWCDPDEGVPSPGASVEPASSDTGRAGPQPSTSGGACANVGPGAQQHHASWPGPLQAYMGWQQLLLQ